MKEEEEAKAQMSSNESISEVDYGPYSPRTIKKAS